MPAPSRRPPTPFSRSSQAAAETGVQEPRPSDRGTGSSRSAAAEVRKDVLETTRLHLLQALELDPASAKAHAMLLVTLYRLGRPDAVMQALRQARGRGVAAWELRAVPRCLQMIEEELRARRLPPDQHAEFMEYLRG